MITPEVIEISETKVTELSAADPAFAPHMGREYTGCTVGIEAFASPVYEEVSWAVSNRHGFTDLSPGDYSRFQYHLRFHSKVLRLPKDKVRECTEFHRTTMCEIPRARALQTY